jgi:hypothetical protein
MVLQVVAGSLFLAAFFIVPVGTMRGLFWQLLLWTTVAAVLVGLRVHRPPARKAWGLMAAGIAMIATFALPDPRFGVGGAPAELEPLIGLLCAGGYILVGWEQHGSPAHRAAARTGARSSTASS